MTLTLVAPANLSDSKTCGENGEVGKSDDAPDLAVLEALADQIFWLH